MESNSYNVNLFPSNGSLPNSLAGMILIQQSSSWNDFGYLINAKYKAQSKESAVPIEGDLLIGFIPKVETESELNALDNEQYELLGSIDKALMYKSNGVQFDFFTHFPNMQEYRKVIKELGVEEAQRFLNSLNNIVLLGQDKSIEAQYRYKKITQLAVFRRAFMRNSEAFFAFHNAETLLAGVEFENYSAISNQFDLQFQLDGFKNEHKIKFRFGVDSNPIIPHRINVLIGKNGLGKSLTLNKLCRAILQREEPSSTKLKDINHDEAKLMLNRLIALVSPGEASTTFPGEYANNQKTYYRKINLNNNVPAKERNYIGPLLAQLSRSEDLIRDEYRIDIFKRAISKVIDIGSLYVKADEEQYHPLERLGITSGFYEQGLKTNEIIQTSKQVLIKINDSYFPLSSGQLTFFQFALQCCLYIENGTLIVLDEPETHMHPNFMGEFIELLDYILEHTGSYAVIATHSPYFVREVGREQVHIFSADSEGVINISTPRLRTFGADIESISQFVFDEDIENRLTDKIFEKVKHKSFEDVESELGNELSLGVLMDLKARFEELEH